MARINLLLADSRENYIVRLAEYISAEYPVEFRVSCFTQLKMMAGYTEEIKETRYMILAGKGIYNESLDREGALTAILSDDNGEESYKGKPCIYRYQPAGKIVSQCMDLYEGRIRNRNAGACETDMVAAGAPASRSITEIISAVSPLGGSGKTLILYSLACILAGMGLKVLLISLESIPTLECLTSFENVGKYGLSEVILGMKKKDRNIPLLIDRYRDNGYDGFDYIRPAECISDIEELNPSEVRDLLGSIRKSGRYDFVIIDSDHLLTGRNLAILEVSSVIFTLFCGTPTEKYRYDRMMRHIATIGEKKINAIKSKQLFIMNHCRQGGTASSVTDMQLPSDSVMDLPFCADVIHSAENCCRINTGSSFCNKLADIISARSVFQNKIMCMVSPVSAKTKLSSVEGASGL